MSVSVKVPHLILLLLLLSSRPIVPAQNTCTPGVSGYKVIRCPEGWARYNLGKCFKPFFSKPVSHEVAQDICRQHDSYLASIHSDEELQFLRSYILRDDSPVDKLRNAWIGGMRKGKLWIWDDLSPFDYSNWLQGYPNDALCAELITHTQDLENRPQHYGKMATFDCNTTLNFICQKYQVDTGIVTYIR